MHLDTYGSRPAVLRKLVIAGGRPLSFALAATRLQELAEITLGVPHVRRITEQIGTELIATREVQTPRSAVSTRPPRVANVPALAIVEVEGGRLQVRASDAGRGVHDPAWKEDKMACLVTMPSTAQEDDPHPDLPASFSDPSRVAALVRGVSARGR